MNVYGIIAIQDYDSQGERFDVGGIDVTGLYNAVLTKSVESKGIEDTLGVITRVKKVLSQEDVEDTFDSTLWEKTRHTPFVEVRATIIDEKLNDVLRHGGNTYFAFRGVVLEREIESKEFDKNFRATLKKTILTGVATTLHPTHRLYRMIPVEEVKVAPKPASKHPMQDIAYDDHGVIRFRENQIVKRLVEYAAGAGWGLNEIALAYHRGLFTQEDWEQFNQLTGWSVSGYGDINGVSAESVAEADAVARTLYKNKENK